MKNGLRKLFAPLLNIFENDEGDYAYKPMSRGILIVIALLFGGLTVGMVVISQQMALGWGALIPVSVFSAVSLFCLIIGGLGTDRAVARVWGSR
ncbi:MAG: hypothetical protein P8M71_07180 [Pseudomonadales bacterium]|nr:hypothetical protein [Pseudomonadales bacterium]